MTRETWNKNMMRLSVELTKLRAEFNAAQCAFERMELRDVIREHRGDMLRHYAERV
jgi:hypothetical protein